MLLTPSLPPSNTVCVIGGGGFLGRAVVAELLARRRRVLVLGRAETPALPLPAGAEYRQNNPHDETHTALQQALTEADEVVDLAYATVPQSSFQDPVHDLLANVPGTVRLFELAATLPLRKFVWVSSGGAVYGRTGATPLPEDHPTAPISPYGITKLTLEKYAHLYFESRGLPVVCVRPSNAFGPGQRPYSGQGFVATAIASVLDGRELVLYGEQGTVRDYLYVSDLARGIVAALEHGRPGQVYNLGSGRGLSNRQVLDALVPLAAEAGYDLRLKIMPARPFDAPYNVLDSAKLRADTGWAPEISFERALPPTWQWYATRSLSTPLPV